jgi:multiple sugar transport system substrate-binding protein
MWKEEGMEQERLKGKDAPGEEAPETQAEQRISRKKFVSGAGVAGAGIVLGGIPGLAEAKAWTRQSRNKALANGLAPGMIGGPTGFKGAERYQFPANSEEGRAFLALRALRKAGKAPDTLVMQVLNFAEPQFQKGYPAGSPSVVAWFAQATGIKIKFIVTNPASEYQDNLRNASTKNGSFDLVTYSIPDFGDFAEAGLLRPLDDFVAKYKPSWYDRKYGYFGGKPTVNLFNTYKGRFYAVAFDNDTQPYVYRWDLFNDPKEKANFAAKYGHPLDFPKTWDEQAKIAAFFTRPNANPPLYGSVERKTPFWGIVNWQQRFVCSADPNMYYFKADGSANCNNEAGIRAAEEHVRSLDWSEPGNLTKDWLSQYQLFGAGSGVMGGTFPNVTKLVVPANTALDKGYGKFLRTDVSPGRIVNGKLIRRPVIFYNISYGVNAFAPKSHHEAAYLLLQLLGGARIYSWIAANPGGYQDPHHTYSLHDPLVRQSYGPEPTDALVQIIPRTAPPINIRGAAQYNQALDVELQKALTKQQSPAQAMANVERSWNQITKRLGTENQVKAIKAYFDAWPPKGRYGPTQTIAKA